MIGIYKITSPSNKIYIGQSTNLFERIEQYSKLFCKSQRRLYNSLKKYGFNNHKFEIIELCGEPDLNYWERYYQDLYNVIGKEGLNCKLTKTDSKSGKHSLKTIFKMTGLKRSDEMKLKMKNRIISDITKKKLSILHKGKKLSATTLLKLKNYRKGIKLSEEHKLKIGKSLKGIPLSNETKRKLSESHKGKIISEKQREKIRNTLSKKVIDTKTNIIYNSTYEISKIFNINSNTLRGKLNGNSKNNTTFKYL